MNKEKGIQGKLWAHKTQQKELGQENKVKDLSSSSKAIDNILSHILKLLYRCLNLHQMEDANCIMIVST